MEVNITEWMGVHTSSWLGNTFTEWMGIHTSNWLGNTWWGVPDKERWCNQLVPRFCGPQASGTPPFPAQRVGNREWMSVD